MKKFTYQFAHMFDGFADEKFVEVDGKKYLSDDGKEPKKDDKGQPVPFVEKKDESNKFDASKASLEELANVNPTIKKMLDDQKQAAIDAKKKEDEDLAKKGEWEKIATDTKKALADAEIELSKKSDIVGKYIESVKKVLANVIETIPKEKRGLVPASFSPREQLEYIIENAALLGAKVTNAKGGDVPPNDGKPDATAEEKLVNEVNELIKKGATRTPTENQLLWERSQSLQKLQKERLAKK